MARSKKTSRQFGARIRRLRLEAGMTVTDLADEAQMSITYLSKVERGELPPPSEKKIRRLASALGVEPGELLTFANRVPADVLRILQRHPAQYAALIRATRNLHGWQLEDLLDLARSEGLADEQEG